MNTRISIEVVHSSKDIVQAVVSVHELDSIGNIKKLYENFLATVDIGSEGFSGLNGFIAPIDDSTKQKILMYLKGYWDSLRKEKKNFFWYGA